MLAIVNCFHCHFKMLIDWNHHGDLYYVNIAQNRQEDWTQFIIHQLMDAVFLIARLPQIFAYVI